MDALLEALFEFFSEIFIEIMIIGIYKGIVKIVKSKSLSKFTKAIILSVIALVYTSILTLLSVWFIFTSSDIIRWLIGILGGLFLILFPIIGLIKFLKEAT